MQYRVSEVATDAIERSGATDRVWLEYAYHKLQVFLGKCWCFFIAKHGGSGSFRSGSSKANAGLLV